MPFPNFDDTLLESVEDVLKQILGDEATKLIYRYVERKGSIKWKELPVKVEVLCDGLQDLLGSSSILLENLILKNLCSRLELKFEKSEDYDFADYIDKLRNDSINSSR